ncbi:hypothetical protein D3C76_975040 [compost metagenome]
MFSDVKPFSTGASLPPAAVSASAEVLLSANVAFEDCSVVAAAELLVFPPSPANLSAAELLSPEPQPANTTARINKHK